MYCQKHEEVNTAPERQPLIFQRDQCFTWKPLVFQGHFDGGGVRESEKQEGGRKEAFFIPSEFETFSDCILFLKRRLFLARYVRASTALFIIREEKG
jgi:hypothetical protein